MDRERSRSRRRDEKEERQGPRQVFDFKVFLNKDFIKEGAAADSYLNKVELVNG